MTKKNGLFGLAALLALIGIGAGEKPSNVVTPEPETIISQDPYIPPPVDVKEPEPISGTLFEENVITPTEYMAETYPKTPEWTEIPYVPEPVVGELFEEVISIITVPEYLAETHPIEGPGVVPYETPEPVYIPPEPEIPYIEHPYPTKFYFR